MSDLNKRVAPLEEPNSSLAESLEPIWGPGRLPDGPPGRMSSPVRTNLPDPASLSVAEDHRFVGGYAAWDHS